MTEAATDSPENRYLVDQARRGGCPHPSVVRQSRTRYNRALPNVAVQCDCAFGDGSMCSIDPYALHQRCVILKKYRVILRSGATKDLVEITVGDPSLRSG